MQRLEGRIVLYFIKQPESDRFFKGDVFIRTIIRRLIRGKPRPGGVEKVFINLCKGLDHLGVKYIVNLPFCDLLPNDRVAILGAGTTCLSGYNKPNKILAGIGLMTHPSEWPNLCEQYPIVKYLQHSEWANNIYKPYFKEKCAIWPVGIETDKWTPDDAIIKEFDFLIYNKIHWNYGRMNQELLEPIRKSLKSKNLKHIEFRYGNYQSEDYRKALSKSKAMIFMSEHESQGIAYQEALSSGVPIFAWDQGKLIDSNYELWGDEDKPTTSVPYFDDRCGMKFINLEDYYLKIDSFISRVNSNAFSPREYVVENLSLEKSTEMFLDFIYEIE